MDQKVLIEMEVCSEREEKKAVKIENVYVAIR